MTVSRQTLEFVSAERRRMHRAMAVLKAELEGEIDALRLDMAVTRALAKMALGKQNAVNHGLISAPPPRLN